ncbi:MAG: hypothetical protein QOI20_863 [Acidimicrobiaceae bacterium]|nr:hypothetical protein [Acidimicrobiaceae bacterium]
MEPTRLRPLEIGEILDTAIKVYRARFATLVKVVFVVVAPVQAFSAVVRISLPSESIVNTNELGQNDFDVAALIGSIAAVVLISILTWVAAELATAAALKIVSDSYLGEERDWQESLRFAAARLRSLIWLALLSLLLLGVGLVLCVVPGVYLWTAWSVAIPVLLLENQKGMSALRRSRDLVRGHWWRVFVCLIVSFILAGVITGVFQGVLAGVVFGAHNEVVSAVASAMASIAASALVTPFTAAVSIVIYFDLRVRKEGFDIELLARTLGVDPPAGLAAASADAWAQDDISGLGGPGGPGGPGAAGSPGTEQPPFWPPPPGWRPQGG